jgi:dipeptide/tripeptide permease
MYFSCNVAFSSLSSSLPTILSEMGFSAITSQGLSAPPSFLSFLLVIASTYTADRTQQRSITIIILSLIGVIGYTLLATTSAVGLRYTGVLFAAAGIFPCIGNIPPWVLNNQGSDTRRGMGIAILNLVGQCGPLLGTRIYPGRDAPYYRLGMWLCAGFMLFNALLALGLRCLLALENHYLDQKFGKREAGAEGIGGENAGPGFRYAL